VRGNIKMCIRNRIRLCGRD